MFFDSKTDATQVASWSHKEIRATRMRCLVLRNGTNEHTEQRYYFHPQGRGAVSNALGGKKKKNAKRSLGDVLPLLKRWVFDDDFTFGMSWSISNLKGNIPKFKCLTEETHLPWDVQTPATAGQTGFVQNQWSAKCLALWQNGWVWVGLGRLQALKKNKVDLIFM